MRGAISATMAKAALRPRPGVGAAMRNGAAGAGGGGGAAGRILKAGGRIESSSRGRRS